MQGCKSLARSGMPESIFVLAILPSVNRPHGSPSGFYYFVTNKHMVKKETIKPLLLKEKDERVFYFNSIRLFAIFAIQLFSFG